MKRYSGWLLLSLVAASTAAAQVGVPPKGTAPSGQVYRCGNQYLDRPCTEAGGKLVKITANVVTSTRTDGGPGERRRPPQCASMQTQAGRFEAEGRGKASNQALADHRAKMEEAGC